MSDIKRSFLILCAAFFWCCFGEVEHPCVEDDSVTLLHTAKVKARGMAPAASQKLASAADTSLTKPTNATQGVTSTVLSQLSLYVQQLSNKSALNATKAAMEYVRQLSNKSAVSMQTAESGFFSLFGLVVLVGLALGCCAIASTTSFVQQRCTDSHPSMQALQERRQRIMAAVRGGHRTAAQEKAVQQSGPPSQSALAMLQSGHQQRYQEMLQQHQQLQSQLGPMRQVVVSQPLQGDRLGIILTDTTLIITSISDPRAAAMGFVVGERIVLVNGVLVRQQADFQLVLAQAMQQLRQTGQPIIVFTQIHPEVPEDAGASSQKLPVFHDLTGHWTCASGESFIIQRVPGQADLAIDAQLGSIFGRGVLEVDGPELVTLLRTQDGLELGQVRISYEASEQSIDCFFRREGADWHKPLRAQRAAATPEALAQMPSTSQSLQGFVSETPAPAMTSGCAAALPAGAALSEAVGVPRDRAPAMSGPGLSPTSVPPTLPPATSLPLTLPQAPLAASLPAALSSTRSDDSQPLATPAPSLPAMQSAPAQR